MKHISDYIRDPSVFQPHKFNLIQSPCGTGKSHFAARHILSLFPDVKPCEVVLITSRAITVEQQTAHYDTLTKHELYDLDDTNFWRGAAGAQGAGTIKTMTFDKVISTIAECNIKNGINFRNVKLFIVDECHTLVTDRFIQGIEAVTTYLRLMMIYSDMIVIGMTATPAVLLEEITTHGFDINLIQPPLEPMYKAKQLTVLPSRSIAAFINSSDLPGKTIVMAKDYAAAKDLRKLIPHSAILVSHNNRDDWNEVDMRPIWNAIVNEETIPDTYTVTKRSYKKILSQETRPLKVLITTSVFREGLNLREHSGVRNIVCGFADAMHVIQFAGRCRYNIDNLVVACDGYFTNKNSNKVLEKQCILCNQFYHRINNDYFRLIGGIVGHPLRETHFYGEYISAEDFRCYVQDHYLVPDGDRPTSDRIISSKEEREALRAIAKACGLLGSSSKQKSFDYLLEAMRENLGFVAHKTRISTGCKRKQGWYFTISEADGVDDDEE